MICIYCSSSKTQVTNSRAHKKHPQTWRRRLCRKCNKVFTSYERPSCNEIVVINASGKQQNFNIGTLTISLYLAGQHDQNQALYDSYYLAQTIELEIIKHITSDHNKTIQTSKIIEISYNTLKRFDEAMALQYAIQQGYISSIRRRGRPSVSMKSI